MLVQFPDRYVRHSASMSYNTIEITWCCIVHRKAQIAKSFGSTSIRHWPDTSTSDRYLIDVDPRVFAIWEAANILSWWASYGLSIVSVLEKTTLVHIRMRNKCYRYFVKIVRPETRLTEISSHNICILGAPKVWQHLMDLLTTYWAPQGRCLPLLYPWLYWLLTEHPKGGASHCYTHGFTDYLLSTPRAVPPIAIPMALLTTYWASQGRYPHCYTHDFANYVLGTPAVTHPIAMPMALLTTYWAPQGQCFPLLYPWLWWHTNTRNVMPPIAIPMALLTTY